MPAKILLVDDEIDILDEASEALIDEGYSCLCADSAAAALEMLGANPDIALVITDLKMPGRTGAELIREATERFDREIRFIVMSGHASPRVETNGVDIDDYPFLRKPLDIGRFLEIVEAVLTTDNWRRDWNRRRR